MSSLLERVQKQEKQREIREAYRQAIRSDQRLGRAVPETLLHYTTLEAFYSITSTHSIRACRAELSNDTGEMMLAADVVREALAEREAKTTLPTSMIESVGKRLAVSATSTMVTCFTEPRTPKASEKLLPADILSMWRAYGDSGDGVAIHFDSEALKTLAANGEGVTVGARLLRVIYDPDDQFDIVKSVIRLAGPELIEKLPEKSPEWMAWAAQVVTGELSSFAAMFKHSGFAEEREWRLVCNVYDFEIDSIGFMDQRGVKRGCIHLVTRVSQDESLTALFALEQKAEEEGASFGSLDMSEWSMELQRLPITGITIGPSSRQHAAAISAAEWSKSHGYRGRSELQVFRSRIPFRGL